MNKKITIILITFILILLILITTSSAVDIDPGAYKDVSTPDFSGGIGGIADTVFNLVQQVGAGIAAIYVVVLGIRYMISSVDDRAEIKRKATPFVIGIAIFFGITFFVDLLRLIASWLPTSA